MRCRPRRTEARKARGQRPLAFLACLLLPVAGGQLPVYTSLDWTLPQPAITRAVVIVHGLDRNAGDYFATAVAALKLSGTDPATVALAAPQFPAAGAPAVLRWHHWADGAAAESPAPVSSFAALDAVLARLGDQALFPRLRRVVLAGFSAGGQLVQRYAAVGHPPAGMALRYVVGSPSSYLYFTAERPGPTAACPGYNDWRYGLAGRLPAYIGASPNAAALEHAYAGADIVYLLGGADTDPAQRVLDRSCAAEAQGPTRLARGIAFTDALMARVPAARAQRRWIIPGVGHSFRRIFTAACGVAALFETPGCAQP